MSADSKATTMARKEHRCILCGKPIPAGAEYIYDRVPPWECGDGDRGWYSFRAHQECNDIWRRVGEECDWYLPDPGDWQEFVDLDRARHNRVLYPGVRA